MSNPERAAFVSRYGGIYEHSPWVAEQAWDAAEGRLPAAALAAALAASVDRAPRERQLALIRAHPDLAGKAAIAGELTEDSGAEQAAAGIDRLSEAEYREFQALNRQYREKFGFPFVMAVRKSGKAAILRAFRERLRNDGEAEFDTAIGEIHKIARLRLEAMQEQT